MPEELLKLLIVVGLSLVVSLTITVPIILWRLIRRKFILPKGKRLNSPNVFYAGIVLFGSFAALSFFTHRPYFGSAILLGGGSIYLGINRLQKRYEGIVIKGTVICVEKSFEI